MPKTLSKEQRNQLARVTQTAREAAERAARAAIENLAVHEGDYRPHMTVERKQLRNRLRARSRALGDTFDQAKGTQTIDHLVADAAYEHWHRLLFTRFLTENHLLHTDEIHGTVPVTLADCDELAHEMKARDGFDLACRFASRTLPGVFRTNDPVLDLTLALDGQVELRKLVMSLPAEVFTADDSLGWTYQFWQAKQKEEVNVSGRKIGADELPAVTQLFTEDYMVEFLLHNTLGAWWAGKLGPIAASTEEEARAKASLPAKDGLPGITWTYLRFVKMEAVKVEAASCRLICNADQHAQRQDAAATLPDQTIGYFHPEEPIANLTGSLPHWRQEGVTYFVTFRTADALPEDKLRQWRQELEDWQSAHPEPLDEPTRREFHARFPSRLQQWLDNGHGACALRNPEIKHQVESALRHFDGQRYHLGEYALAANHVHVIVTPIDGHDLSEILHSWKSFTAKKINATLGQSGNFWQKESFDHIVRNPESLHRFQIYIKNHDNAVKVEAASCRLKVSSDDNSQRQDAAATQDTNATPTWVPAAGTFPGWPKHAAQITFLDPCMGSGHFVVFALPILARLRMAEEALNAKDAVIAVLRDNLHGLEIDPRCTQIGAFNVALAAWKIGGWQKLPSLHIACSGLAPQAKLADWLKLAGDSDKRRRGMERLYKLFEQAPVLGSLINPRLHEGDLLEAGYEDLVPLLEQAMADERANDTMHELAVTAQGMAKAAEILAGQFVLVGTNVPYLTVSKHEDFLRDFGQRCYPDSRHDLATIFVERCLPFALTTAVVTPQNWLFLPRYKKIRQTFLKVESWHFASRLGPGAFETINGEVVKAALVAISHCAPSRDRLFVGIDVSEMPTPDEKATALLQNQLQQCGQAEQLRNPDARIILQDVDNENLLMLHADSRHGLRTADGFRFLRSFWELPSFGAGWSTEQGTVEETVDFGGREQVVLWEDGQGALRDFADQGLASLQGSDAWGKQGLTVSLMGNLPVTRYSGDFFDNNCAALWPRDPNDLAAVWAFCASPEFPKQVRVIDQQLKVTSATLLKVPFDLAHWQRVAAEKYPHGLPKPYSDDPTQWLFDGYPVVGDKVKVEAASCRLNDDSYVHFQRQDAAATLTATLTATSLQVAVARLLGYLWPRQTGSSFPDCPALGPDGLEPYADADGIVCLPPIHKEQPAGARLRTLLAAVFGTFDERALLTAAGAKKATLEEWLRDEFFEQHCDLFHQRPFIWHVWDGRKDGFHALVNYHKLDHAALQKLTYSYLGDWIRQQDDDAKADKPGAADRLGAARDLQAELAKILEGEAPYDIFVRWKSLKEQAIGWHPDLNDGVRLNIRPFLMAADVGKKGAGVLRAKPNIKWEKDRGKEPERDKKDFPWFWCEAEPESDKYPTPGKTFAGHRWNNVHLTLARKRQARE